MNFCLKARKEYRILSMIFFQLLDERNVKLIYSSIENNLKQKLEVFRKLSESQSPLHAGRFHIEGENSPTDQMLQGDGLSCDLLVQIVLVSH